MKGLFICFIVLQIGLDLAHSVTFFPFTHYGMFSAVEPRPDSVLVYKIVADGRRLQPADFTIYRWDMVQTPLEAYDKQTATHDYAFDKDRLQQGMRWAGAGSLYSALKTNLDNTGDFPSWYKSYLGGLLGHRIGSLRVEKAWYRWQDGRLLPIGKESWINL
ncbi:MAG TPA: hypothetical protein VGQ51_18640 [Puia sp.]|nr:hypothetical protein [Puia sp.]